MVAPMKVAIQGELGSFSHQAARRLLPGSRVLPCATSADVFEALASGRATKALIPIENSLAGTVAEHFDLLLAHGCWIERESLLRIEHNLMAAPGTKLRDLRRVFSHPVALAQCREFFKHHRHIEPVPFYDTAGSVKHVVAKGLRDAGAIAGREAAVVYHARILRGGIEDDKRNFTRFFLLGRSLRKARGADKTTIAFTTKNIAGALFKALSVFALRDISLTRIQSRPVRGRPWEYVFFVDFLRGDDEAARNALRHLGEISHFVKVLGIYRGAHLR